MPPAGSPRFLIGVSHKMYFSHARTVDWCRDVAAIARDHPAIADGTVELFVIPTYLSVPAALEAFQSVALVGAQDLSTEDSGAYTGEVSGSEIAELGCRVVEVGHAERRRLFGETDEIVASKTDAALRNGLDPVLCIGEAVRTRAEDAIADCTAHIASALEPSRTAGHHGRVIVAYEPHWAIGAPEPASAEYIGTVCSALREYVGSLSDFPGSVVIYGGSAGPGLLGEIADSVDGMFLGRFAHDPEAVRVILDEAADAAT
ncbi:triose-phosphate isomerase [Mycetocola zhujimingii]|nr:triose-phosphate isomerase [Mycetocola zhujimingii]